VKTKQKSTTTNVRLPKCMAWCRAAAKRESWVTMRQGAAHEKAARLDPDAEVESINVPEAVRWLDG
jgi:hypothetical protein